MAKRLQTTTALRGPMGPQGPQGPQGDPGTGVTILGSFETEEALNAAHPTGTVGQSYLVGGYLYVWSETTSKWENVGNIQGPAGPAGAAGPQGPAGATGPQGPAGPAGAAFTYDDFTEEQLQAITGPQGPAGPAGATGPAGADGKTPARGTDYWTEADKAEIKAYVDEAILGGAW